jgi:hypothetical protein
MPVRIERADCPGRPWGQKSENSSAITKKELRRVEQRAQDGSGKASNAKDRMVAIGLSYNFQRHMHLVADSCTFRTLRGS